MLAIADATKMAGILATNLPVLTQISTVAEHDAALKLMEELIEDYDSNLILIEALGNSISRYEDVSERFAVFNKRQSDIDPGVATLKVLMDQYGLNTTDFENEIGKKSMVSQVIGGKRNLTREHIIKLSKRFGVNAAIFF